MSTPEMAWRPYAASVMALWLAACSSTASVRHIEKPQDPVQVVGMNVVFLQPTFQFDSSDPRLSNAKVNEQVSELRQAVLERVPAGLASMGIETSARSFALGDNGRPPASMASWLSSQRTDWHLLTVVPSGARVFCSGGFCNLKTQVFLEINAPNSLGRRWAVELTESNLAPDFSMTTQGASNHYANEMVRVLREGVQGPKAP